MRSVQRVLGSIAREYLLAAHDTDSGSCGMFQASRLLNGDYRFSNVVHMPDDRNFVLPHDVLFDDGWASEQCLTNAWVGRAVRKVWGNCEQG